MASFPHLYSDHLLPPNTNNTFSDVHTLLMPAGDSGMCTITPNHHLHLAAAGQPFIPSPSHALSPLLTMPCPVSDMTVPSWPESNMGLYGIHSFVGSQAALPGACEYGDEVFGYVPELKPAYSSSSNYEMGGVEESNIKVAIRYSEEERKERIVRYLKKRNQRNFNKTIKYACRKTLADRRTRVRGRFARNNNELCHTQIPLQTNQLNKQRDQTKKEEEESWLQELAASLMYLPYVTDFSGLDDHL
ncbi:uncharacterized protein LOC111795062 isoform X1 [Cucurbita pepo subsp. pepo]|uniref:uncharacterized protein LOC111795062 isoform X1 n=1 Tax=Cucurbita pepo subsp. pepo TaxID=3664 RepID=UPI000C9D5D0F|nr:uncharacterized protein LOC111795062 isoform X1 [Cucurbita pepo subsp. pepo]